VGTDQHATPTSGAKTPVRERGTAYAVLSFLACQAVVFAVALAGAWATQQGVNDWYPALRKPPLTPPNWVFPVVWNILFFLMGVALWLAVRAAGSVRRLGVALVPFALQLGLNLAWSFLFFTFHWVGAAVADAVILISAIMASIRAFAPFSRIAALCLVPYLVWVSFALYLTTAIWALNG